MSAILKAKYSKLLQRRGRILTFVPIIFEVVSTGYFKTHSIFDAYFKKIQTNCLEMSKQRWRIEIETRLH